MTPHQANPDPAAHGLLACLAANNRRFPDKVLMESVDQDKRITYGQFYQLTNRIARLLQSRGIGANDRIAILSENSIEHFALYFGVMRFGATMCTIHVEMNAVYFADILNAVAPKLTLFAADIPVDGLRDNTPGEWMALGEWDPDGGTGFFAEAAKQSDAPVAAVNGPEDDAVIFYTSGTDSSPKGVVVTFREALATAVPTADMLALTEADRILEFRSMNWYSEQIFSGLSVLYRGATVILLRRFTQSRYFDLVQKHKVTIGVCNPTGLAMFLNRPVAVTGADMPHLRFMTSSSAPLSVEQWQRFEEQYGIPVAQGYGCSEVGWIAGSNEADRRLGSVGKPYPYLQLGIIEENGGEAPVGGIGEIELGGFKDNRYRYLSPDGSEKVGATGRFRTGDLGFLDAEGYLYLTGRVKDLIIRGGVNVSPAEIDAILLQMPDIAEAAAIGVPDAIYGQEVVAYVVASDGCLLTEADVLAHCGAKLPAFRMPKEIILRGQLPKSERGKMNRNALVEDWKAAHPAG